MWNFIPGVREGHGHERAGPGDRKLNNKVLLGLNAKIDVDGQEPAQVAFDWLKKEGFVTG
jgi:osmoprotectant transport system substrate-binding protein